MTELKLYSMPSSGNSYKVRLLLSLMQRSYMHVALEADSPELGRVHEEGWLPFGKLPVLELGDGTRMPESNAILCYLAEGTGFSSRRSRSTGACACLDVLGTEPA